jgi:hypothetical protein
MVRNIKEEVCRVKCKPTEAPPCAAAVCPTRALPPVIPSPK